MSKHDFNKAAKQLVFSCMFAEYFPDNTYEELVLKVPLSKILFLLSHLEKIFYLVNAYS